MIVMVMIIGNMVFVWNMVVNFKFFYFLVYINDFIYIFVVYNYRYWNGFLRLFVLVVNVYVGVVNGGFVNFN